VIVKQRLHWERWKFVGFRHEFATFASEPGVVNRVHFLHPSHRAKSSHHNDTAERTSYAHDKLLFVLVRLS
jgi:hypothetical protein